MRFLLSAPLVLYAPFSLSHHPHDMIDALAVSPAYGVDKTVYIANAMQLFKSINGGRSWQELTHGLENTHVISSVSVAPNKTSLHTLFVSTLGNGIYRSTNAGGFWKNTSNGLKDLAIDIISARSDELVFAIDSAGRLYRTQDSGETWKAARLPQEAIITALSPPSYLSNMGILAGDHLGRILLSTDEGSTWKVVGQLPDETVITVIDFDPSDTSGLTYFIGTKDKGLYTSTAKGTTFSTKSISLPITYITSLVFSPNFLQNHTMYVTGWGEAVFISTDNGASWVKYDDGLTTSEQADVYQSPHFRQLQTTLDNNKTMFLAAFDGLFKSDNGGQNWYQLETQPVNIIKSLNVSPASNGIVSVGVGTYGGGAYVSPDQGTSWIIGNKGLYRTRLTDIKFSPAFPEDRTLFSGSQGNLLKSSDGGATWQRIPLRYSTWRKKVINKLSSLGIPRKYFRKYLKEAELHWVYPTVIGISPDYANDRTLFFGTRRHGIYRSQDAGNSQNNIGQNMEEKITSIALSPNFSKDHTLFVYVRRDGVYKSTDSGNSWQKIVSGLYFAPDESEAIKDRFKPKDLSIVFSPDYERDNVVFAAGSAGLFKSHDQGENWRRMNDKVQLSNPNILAIDISPNYANDRTIIISVKGRGLYRSTDGGNNFVNIDNTLIGNNHGIKSIVYSSDYLSDNTVFAASDVNLFRSIDGGDSWTLLKWPVRYEDLRDVIHYDGQWIEEKNSEYSASTVHYSETQGAKASFKFVGCGIRWIATKSPQGGTANVTIDDISTESVQLFSEQPEPMSEVYSKTGLSCAPHRIVIELDKDSIKNSSGRRITLDAFDVLPPA